MHSTTDKVTIETPEQITLELPLAGVGSRFLALALDTLIQAGLVILMSLAMAGIAWLAPTATWPLAKIPASIMPAVVILFFFCLYWGYFAFFEVIWKGQTPGKKAAGIRVIKDIGRPINTFESIGRNLMRAVDGFPLYGIGIVCMMLNRQHKRLGDYVAGTLVVHDKAVSEFRPDWTPAMPTVEAARAEVAKVSADELVLVESYLHRRIDLDPAVRAASALRIVNLIASKTGLKPEPGQSEDDFLEMLVREVRDGARLRS